MTPEQVGNFLIGAAMFGFVYAFMYGFLLMGVALGLH